ncbi:MAG: hypothetical protein ABJF88_04415 [Rhodothermales bacterium]
MLLLVAFVAGCDTTDDSGIATFTGRVVEADGTPVGGANVVAPDYGITAVTNGQGVFTLSVEVDSSRQDIALDIFADGYQETSRSVLAFVDQDTRIPEVVLIRRGSNGGGDGGGDGDGDGDGGIDDGADEPSGPAASITLVQRSSQSIGVQSAGADETATLTFIVLDAFGNPVDADNGVDVNFVIGNGPGGGEFIAPAVKRTNGSGRVQTTISSGTRAGTVQVEATATNQQGTVIRSLPVVVTITGGLPHQEHFTVGPQQFNFPGYDVNGVINPITAIVGDIYANPVQPGTAVYFTTNAGIVEGAGTTDALGRTTVSMISAAPRTSGDPPAVCDGASREGYAQITATTSDLNQQTITATTSVLLSAQTEIVFTDVDSDPDNGDLGNYGFRVSDRFGHPLAPGTRIAVTADGVNVEAVGDDQTELGDYLCPGPGRTDFLISVVQGDETNEDDLPLPPQLETLTIRVTSPNGNAQLTRYNTGNRPEIVFERFDQ